MPKQGRKGPEAGIDPMRAPISSGHARRSRSRWLPAAALAAMTLLAYLPALRAGWIWDDDHYVTENPTLHDLNGLRRIWTDPLATPQYYPLVHTSFWIEHHLWGMDPVGYHLINILLHAGIAILLWQLLRRLSMPGAFLAAAVFAVHPVQTETVAWVTERKNLLSALFYLLSLLAYLEFRPLEEGAASGSRRRYGWSLACFALALLSKTVAGSLPVAIVLLLWWKRGRVAWRDLLPLLPFIGLAICGGAATVALEKSHVGAFGEEWSLGPIGRLLLAGRSLWFYTGKLIWPAKLDFEYPRWRIDPGVWWQWLFTPAYLGALFVLWRQRRRIGRGPLTAGLFFAVTLIPALGFFDVYPFRFSYVADHFQYQASAGLICLGAASAAAAVHRLRFSRVQAAAGAVALLAALGVLTFRQAGNYRDAETLWRRSIAGNPSAWMAMNNLAVLLNDQGRCSEALLLLDRSLALKPDHAEACYNRGNSHLALDSLDAAIADYGRAIRLNPTYVDAYNNRGTAHLAGHQYPEAVRDFTRALELEPGFAGAWCNRAGSYLEMNRPDLAIADYTRAVALRIDYAEAYSGRGSAFAALDSVRQAASDFDRAIALQPANPQAYFSRGRMYARLGRYAEAILDFTRALDVRPGLAPAIAFRAECRYRNRQFEPAWADVRLLRRIGGVPDSDLVRRLIAATGHPE